MGLIAILILLIVITFVNVYFGRKTENNIGSNIGDKYMKNHWGMDEKEDK